LVLWSLLRKEKTVTLTDRPHFYPDFSSTSYKPAVRSKSKSLENTLDEISEPESDKTVLDVLVDSRGYLLDNAQCYFGIFSVPTTLDCIVLKGKLDRLSPDVSH
jgi:hypothetical protein